VLVLLSTPRRHRRVGDLEQERKKTLWFTLRIIRPFKGLIRLFEGLIRPFKGLIRPLLAL